MSSDIEVGQVIALKIRFNNSGDIAKSAHPYLVVEIDEELGVIEIAQLDSLAGKEWKAFRWGNKPVYATDPAETVIDQDSYVQMDNTIKIENCRYLERFRRQRDKLSANKLQEVIFAYRRYHERHEIDENKNVYMDCVEIMALN